MLWIATLSCLSIACASFTRIVPKSEEIIENGKKAVKTIKEEVTTQLPLGSSTIDVAPSSSSGRRVCFGPAGISWVFGRYGFRNTSDKEETVDFVLKFPTAPSNLAITTGSFVALFVVMQVTGRIRWADKFVLKPTAEPAGD